MLTHNSVEGFQDGCCAEENILSGIALNISLLKNSSPIHHSALSSFKNLLGTAGKTLKTVQRVKLGRVCRVRSKNVQIIH